MVCSWACATLFTNGVEIVVDKYTVKYHHKIVIYMISSAIFLAILVYLSLKTGTTIG